MAPPGILEARYRRLAGDDDRRAELYLARTRLHYSVDEWLALPWWHRRLYLEQMAAEADRMRDPGGSTGGSDPAEAMLTGTLDDVRATGYGAG